MVNRDGALSSFQRGAAWDCTSVPVACQDLFPMAAEVFFILPFECVAN